MKNNLKEKELKKFYKVFLEPIAAKTFYKYDVFVDFKDDCLFIEIDKYEEMFSMYIDDLLLTTRCEDSDLENVSKIIYDLIHTRKVSIKVLKALRYITKKIFAVNDIDWEETNGMINDYKSYSKVFGRNPLNYDEGNLHLN
jgi:hypothetical protein